MLTMLDESAEDAKIIAVPHNTLSREYQNIHKLADLPELLTAQISLFFRHYKELEKNKWAEIEGWQDIDYA